MHPESGKIFDDITEAVAEQYGLVPIPDSELDEVKRMNRKQRRAWAAKQRKKVPA